MGFVGQVAKRPIVIGLGIAAALFGLGGIDVPKKLEEAFQNLARDAENSGGILNDFQNGVANFSGMDWFRKYGAPATMVAAGALASLNDSTRGYGIIAIASGIMLAIYSKKLRMDFGEASANERSADNSLQTQTTVTVSQEEIDNSRLARTDVLKHGIDLNSEEMVANLTKEEAQHEDLEMNQELDHDG